MSEWKEHSLGEFAEIQTGPFGSQLHAADYVSYGTPSIMPTNIGSKLNIVTDKIVYVGDNDIKRLQKYTVLDGDIVYSRRGDVEKCAFITSAQTGWLCGTGCLRIRVVSNKLSSKFCAYYLSSPEIKTWVVNSAVGTTMPNLNSTILGKLPLLVPGIKEQEAIAETLCSLDDKIDLLHRQNKTLEQLAETVFRQWFVEEAEESWESTTIENVCSKINSGGTPATKISEYYNGEINWYATKELNDNFLFESSSKITKEGLENSAAKLFPENTILIAIYAAPTVGRLGILGTEAAFNQAACGFIADESKICFEYLFLHLLMSRQKLNDMASGSAQQNLNVGIMKEFEIVLPPSNVMDSFKKQVRPMYQKIKSNTNQIRTLTQLRDTLLPKLMSGEVRMEMK